MDSILYPTVAALATIVVLARIPGLVRNPRDPARRALVAALAAIAFACWMGTPPVYTWFDRLTGVPNLARLLCHLGIVTLGLCGQTLLLHLALPPHEVRRCRRIQWVFILFYVLAVGAMTALFVAAPVDVDTLDFFSRCGDSRYVGVYTAAYMTYLGVAFVNLTGCHGATVSTPPAPSCGEGSA